jgi:hypothetical protein
MALPLWWSAEAEEAPLVRIRTSSLCWEAFRLLRATLARAVTSLRIARRVDFLVAVATFRSTPSFFFRSGAFSKTFTWASRAVVGWRGSEGKERDGWGHLDAILLEVLEELGRGHPGVFSDRRDDLVGEGVLVVGRRDDSCLWHIMSGDREGGLPMSGKKMAGFSSFPTER